jgi:hypothetical protein
MSTPLSFLSPVDRLGIPLDDFRQRLYQALCDLRVALPCIVQSFDPVKQTVSVTPAIYEKINVTTNGVPVATDVAIGAPIGSNQDGLITDIPIIAMRAGGFSITFPIQQGDECLVIFADMCIDAWWQNGGTQNTQLDKRRHDLSDGFAIIGPWSQPNTIDDYNTDGMEIRSDDGNCKITVTEGEINIVSANGIINIQTQGDANLNVTSAGALNLAGNPINVQSPINFQGAATFSSTATFNDGATMTGTVTIDGRVFTSHTHSGVTTGGGVTGPVS